MSKSYRTSYRRDYKEFWTPRPLTFFSSNKENKKMCHQIERTWARWEVAREVKAYYESE